LTNDSSRAAAIDLGTNTALLLIATGGTGPFKVVADIAETPRLGAGLATTGGLAASAVERTMRTLQGFLGRLELERILAKNLRAVGTEVLRRASNADAFVKHVKSELGLTIEILPAKEEARLGYTAVASASTDRRPVVIDVGGGSCELTWEGGRRRESIPIGALVLTEQFLGLGSQAPKSPGGWPALRARIEQAVEELPEGCARGVREVVVIGGSAVSLGCLALELSAFDAARAEGVAITTEAAAGWAEHLAGLSIAQRRNLPIEADRAEILPAGAACLAAVLRRIGAAGARVSARGLRYGIVMELLYGRGL